MEAVPCSMSYEGLCKSIAFATGALVSEQVFEVNSLLSGPANDCNMHQLALYPDKPCSLATASGISSAVHPQQTVPCMITTAPGRLD